MIEQLNAIRLLPIKPRKQCKITDELFSTKFWEMLSLSPDFWCALLNFHESVSAHLQMIHTNSGDGLIQCKKNI